MMLISLDLVLLSNLLIVTKQQQTPTWYYSKQSVLPVIPCVLFGNKLVDWVVHKQMCPPQWSTARNFKVQTVEEYWKVFDRCSICQAMSTNSLPEPPLSNISKALHCFLVTQGQPPQNETYEICCPSSLFTLGNKICIYISLQHKKKSYFHWMLVLDRSSLVLFANISCSSHPEHTVGLHFPAPFEVRLSHVTYVGQWNVHRSGMSHILAETSEAVHDSPCSLPDCRDSESACENKRSGGKM